MKFNTVAAAAALLAGVAYAEEVEESKAVPELPTFTVSCFPLFLVNAETHCLGS